MKATRFQQLPHIFWYSNTVRLVKILSVVEVTVKSKIFCTNRKYKY